MCGVQMKLSSDNSGLSGLTGSSSKTIEGSRGDALALERFVQIPLVNDAAAGAVHDHDPRLHRADRLGVDEIFGFRRQGRVDGNDVCPPEQLGESDHFHTHLFGPIGCQIRIVGNDVHADALGQLGQMTADLPDPDNP